MMKFSDMMVAGLVVLALSGCSTVPSTSIKTPLTARPDERAASVPHNGAIFQAGRNERPLFEDRRARNVGDVLTISIAESTSTSTSATTNQSHAGSSNSGTPTITRGVAPAGSTAPTLLAPINVSTSSSGALAENSANTGANTFVGTITVTVTEVLPNGNLRVGGEKLVAIDQSNEYIRISGVVDPMTLTGDVVSSTQVSDVRLEYKGAENLDGSQMMTMLGRAFRSVLPF
jgi:flagellar L-ring protein precursor FlgH